MFETSMARPRPKSGQVPPPPPRVRIKETKSDGQNFRITLTPFANKKKQNLQLTEEVAILMHQFLKTLYYSMGNLKSNLPGAIAPQIKFSFPLLGQTLGENESLHSM